MVWLKGGGAVAPDSGDDGFEDLHEERRGVSAWIRKHPVIASVSITILILSVVTVIVVPVICSVHGCPPKKQEREYNNFYDGAPLRLVVSFLIDDVDVMNLVPPLLRPYTSAFKMALSNLQIFEAENEAILVKVLAEIKKRKDLEFVVRDFILRAPSSISGATDGGGGSSSRRLQQAGFGSASGLNDPGLANAYWFDRINVTGAWSQLGYNASDPQSQLSDVIIAVTDSGAAVNHPDLVGSFWKNPDEVDDDLVDNDNNSIIDDVYGACFSTPTCSVTSKSRNASRCGIGRNTSLWNGIVDRSQHGTMITGLIGAQPNNGQGFAGVAPNLRQMVLKVVDDSVSSLNPTYAYSDVVSAVDYGYGKGARIFSMSFGPKGSDNTPANKPGLDEQAAAYRTLFNKYSSALFVAAAGNEWTDLDTWKNGNFTYAPCMVNTANTLCVGATNVNDTRFYATPFNQVVGTNWGANTVDMNAPGMNVYTTNVSGYDFTSGTSFSAPIVAAAGGLVLTALGGQTRATPDTPALIKKILMTSGDDLTSLAGLFRSSQRLNVGKAVAAALTLARTNRTEVIADRILNSVSAPNVSVAFQGWEYTWWLGRYMADRFTASETTHRFMDFRVLNQPTSNFNNFIRFDISNTTNTPTTTNITNGTNTTNTTQIDNTSSYLMMATSMARINPSGMYSIQFEAVSIMPSRWKFSVGEIPMTWKLTSNLSGTVDLIFPVAGFYNMTLWMYPENNSSAINFRWLTPSNPTNWTNPALAWVIHTGPPSSRYYDPGLTDKPAIWHVVWNETTDWSYVNTSDKNFFTFNDSPLLYRGMQTTVSDFSFTGGIDLRRTLYGVGGSPSNGSTVVYGYARANLRPDTYISTKSFRLQGLARLYINGQLIVDFQPDTKQATTTQCVTLQNDTAHELFYYFAAMVNSSNPVGIMWASCSSTSDAPNLKSYSSLTSSLATNYFWSPTDISGLSRGFRCDAWPSKPVTQLGTTPKYGTPPALTWMFPRDCPPSYRVNATGNNPTECRMRTRLSELFPSNITWDMWHIRCFTYYAGSLTRGIAGAVSAPVFQHLAGVRVFTMFQNDITTARNYAPLNTRFPPGMYQLYVIEWVAMGNQWKRITHQSVYDGQLSTALPNAPDRPGADAMPTNSSSMILPPGAEGSFSWRVVTSV